MSLINQSKIITSLNRKDIDGNYNRYQIGAKAENVFYNYLQNGVEKTTSTKNILDTLKTQCLDDDTLKFKLYNPLTIKTNSNSNIIYDGTVSKTIDLSNFLDNTAKWNGLGAAFDERNYKVFYHNGGTQIYDLSYENNKWVTKARSQGSGYNYPKYYSALTYNPTSLCKMILPEGIYFINYGIAVINKYDSSLSNKNYTPNKGTSSNNFKYFVDSSGKKLVEPGIVSATLCGQDRFDKLKAHYYKYYPSDDIASSNQYFTSYPAFTAPRVNGTTLNSAYTGRSFILTVPKQATYHILGMHWHTPNGNNISNGIYTDGKKKPRLVCPISFWLQILNLTPPNKGTASSIQQGVTI